MSSPHSDEFQQAPPSAEVEHKLSVSPALADDVWNVLSEGLPCGYLSADYIVQPAHVEYLDQYYDSPTLTLMRQGCGLRHRVRLSGEAAEVVQLKTEDLQADPSGLRRMEHTFAVWSERYGKPELALMDRLLHEQRPEFARQLCALGVPPESLMPTLALRQSRRRIKVGKNTGNVVEPWLTISLDRVTSRFWWEHFEQLTLEIELDDPQAETLAEHLVEDLRATFPDLTPDQTSKLRQAYDYFDERFVRFPTALRYRTPVEVMGGGALLGVLGILGWLARR